jgi:Na+:H+ antiporter, NhaA family
MAFSCHGLLFLQQNCKLMNVKGKKIGSNIFRDFFESEKSSGLVLIFFTLLSLIITNSSIGKSYLDFWHHTEFGGLKLEYWINDGLMAMFFLLIGLELKREITVGELSDIKNALLPLASALGGMLVPAGIYLIFNFGTTTQSGAGIPMATDIAFALGVLALLGNKVPLSIKVFLTALAVIDDLGAIIVIALFYSKGIAGTYLLGSLGIFGGLLVLNKLKVNNLIIYLIGGVGMWYCMFHSGVHATITGVLLAFAIPSNDVIKRSPSSILQKALHFPVAFIILPIFALANTAIIMGDNWGDVFGHNYSIGIILGLVLGKPLGITLFTFLSVKLKICNLPTGVKWNEIFGVGIIAGIGFTMSIFVTLLAFKDDIKIQNDAKLIILFSSLIAGTIGYIWLNIAFKKRS